MSNIVAIVGRPNVGKSTLFNRLIGKSSSIIDDIPGITRDRHYDTAEWCGHIFTLIDTGGYITSDKEELNKFIAEQVEIAIEEADVILFVVDCQGDILTEDMVLATLLRKSKKPVMVVANKADNLTISLNAHNFHTLGLGEIYQVAATHGSGTGDLLDALTTHFEKPSEKEEFQRIPKIAIVGRPNVGKSTFVNSLLGQERSIVSPKAHTTRTPVNSFYQLYNKRLILTDTAGIRKKNQVKSHSIEFYSVIRSIRAIEQSDVCIILISATKGISTQDQHIIDVAYQRKKGILLLVNKWDLIEKDTETAVLYKKRILEKIPYITHIPILFTSGLHKKGIFQAIQKALEVDENRARRVTTSSLNKILLRAVDRNPTPVLKGKLVKMNYITQLPTPSPTFAIFCNLPQYIPTNYKRYLEKQLRLYVDFQGAPITIVFKKK